MSPDRTVDTVALPQTEDELARRCPGCETVFNVEKGSSRQVFCSRTCREVSRQHTPTERTCPICQKDFVTTVSPRRIYCSKECRTAARMTASEHEKHDCPVCNTTFESPKTVRRIYCSNQCRRTAEKQRDEARDQDRARRLGQAPKPASDRPALPPAELPPPQPRPQPFRPAVRAGQERDPMEPTATRECPHCRQPVTIVALLATPEAARPSVPTGPTDPIPIRRAP